MVILLSASGAGFIPAALFYLDLFYKFPLLSYLVGQLVYIFYTLVLRLSFPVAHRTTIPLFTLCLLGGGFFVFFYRPVSEPFPEPPCHLPAFFQGWEPFFPIYAVYVFHCKASLPFMVCDTGCLSLLLNIFCLLYLLHCPYKPQDLLFFL